MTWVNIALLRILGTTLPIELWHAPEESIPLCIRKEFLMLGARVRQLKAKAKGWFCVPFAVAETTFEEVLVLASDFTPFTQMDVLFKEASYLQHGSLFVPDMFDLRERGWYPQAWTRLGLDAPKCVGSSRCLETDSVVVLLNRRRCPGSGGLLRTLAADAQETDRYGIAGDKELFRIAWDVAGCPLAWLPQSTIAGEGVDVEVGARLFLGYALGIRSLSGDFLGIHWAWGKVMLQHLNMPEFSFMQLPPLTGFGVHTIDWQALPEAKELLNTVLDSNSSEKREYSFYARYRSCHARDGQEVPCVFEPVPRKAMRVLKVFGSVFFEATKAFEDCQGEPRPRLASVRRQNIRTWLRSRSAELMMFG